MNQELEKLQSLLHIPYDTNRFDILLEYFCKTETQTKSSEIPFCISYSIDDEIVDSLFTNIDNPQLLYEYYYCDTDLFKENQYIVGNTKINMCYSVMMQSTFHRMIMIFIILLNYYLLMILSKKSTGRVLLLIPKQKSYSDFVYWKFRTSIGEVSVFHNFMLFTKK